MTKTDIISSIAETPEDKVLLAKTLGRLLDGQQKCIPTFTGFLSEREQSLVCTLASHNHITNVSFWGGFPTAERKIALYIPDYLELDDLVHAEDCPLSAIRIHLSQFDSLTHRDYLGGILGLGIRRDVLGDILVSDSFCDVLLTSDISRFLLTELTKIGRTTVRVSRISLAEIIVPQQSYKSIYGTVASLRLDNIISTGFQISRSRAQNLIKSKRVEVNHTTIEKTDLIISECDVLSVRGLGKIRLSCVKGITKKDRISIQIDRYI